MTTYPIECGGRPGTIRAMTWRRNLVVVLAHGLRSDAVSSSRRSCSWPLITPNLERLGDRGARLVATSACPNDPGGMTSLLTGLHARQHGQVDPGRAEPMTGTFLHWLADEGYHVAGAGVVDAFASALAESVRVADVSDIDPADCAYFRHVHPKGLTAALRQQRRQRLRYGPFEPDRLLIDPEDDIDGFITSAAVRLVEEMPADKPWALVVAYTGPGNALPPPTLYEAVIDPHEVTDGFMPADLKVLDALAELDYPRVMLQRLEPDKLGRIRADYLGRVSVIDYGVGRLHDAAQARRDATRNWLAIASDRGCVLGEHGLVGHRSFLCGAVETPVILAPPRPTAIVPPDLLASTIDVAPTLAALCGVDPSPACPGRSLLPVLEDKPVVPDPPGGLLSEFGHRLMLETERHKAVFSTPDNRAIGLYDLLNDPDERHNLIDKPAGRNIIDALRWRVGNALMPLRAAVLA